jgi:4'-phosphopantetheinyl transferase
MDHVAFVAFLVFCGGAPMSTLSPGTLHIWTVALAGDGEVSGLFSLLSADEQARARGYQLAADRARFTRCRAALREILARYTGLGASGLRFDYGPHGKPALAGSAIAFNVSHSGDLAVIAISGEGPVGVDVEQVRPVEGMEAIAARFFSLEERDALAALAPDERTHAFYQAWTRKEAMLKATGHGLSRALDHDTVSLGADVAPRVLAVAGAPGEVATWQVAEVGLGAGYVGAIAWQGDERAIAVAPWTPASSEHG